VVNCDFAYGAMLAIAFNCLGVVSYSPSTVTMTVSAAILEIFNVKEWPDLEIWSFKVIEKGAVR